MPANYVLLERIELNASASTVTFANIPQSGYTDLKLVMSARQSTASIAGDVTIQFNNSSSSNSNKYVYGDGANTGTGTNGYTPSLNYASIGVGNTATANTHSNVEVYIPNYTSSDYKSFNAHSVGESNSSSSVFQLLVAGLWSSASAINQITLAPVSSQSFLQYSTFSLYGLAASGTTPAVAPKASGGNITTDGTYWIHTFNSTGTFTPLTSLSCDYLVVAGGGGGGSDSGGGGGAGGYKTSIGGSPLSLTSGTAYTVTIGAGGSGSASTLSNGTNGSNSVFSSITSTGGGFGGSNEAGYNGTAGDGAPGGSGGGAGAGGTGTGFHTPGAASPSGQGSAGGLNYSTGGGQRSGGGGGGAGAAGSNGAVSNVGGNGGNGLSNSITGTATYYAGGGGGTGASGFGGTVGTGGLGGGAAGSNSAGIAGTTNTGGGGGASASTTGGSGGSGIVIVRYTIA